MSNQKNSEIVVDQILIESALLTLDKDSIEELEKETQNDNQIIHKLSLEWPHSEESELFWLKINKTVIGLFWKFDLKNYIQQNLTSSEDFEISEVKLLSQLKIEDLKSLAESSGDYFSQQKWANIYDNDFFQRRNDEKASHLQSLSPEQETYYLLENGQKSGPFNYEQIAEMVEKKILLVTDMLSIDEGQTWGRLYEIEEFDRRALKLNQSELPFRPNQRPEDLEQVHATIFKKWKKRKESDTGVIAGLAYVEKVRSGLVKKDREMKDELDKKSTETAHLFSNWSIQKSFYTAAIIGPVILLSIVFWPSDSKHESLSPSASSAAPVQVLEPVERFEPEQRLDSQRSSETASRPSDRPRRERSTASEQRPSVNSRDRSFSRESTPFRQTETYQRAQRQRREREMRDQHLQMVTTDRDDLYYDDASGSLELDPVRRTLSRDIIDPVDEYGDYYDDYYDESPRRNRRVSSFPPSDDDIFDEDDDFYDGDFGQDPYSEHIYDY